MVGGDDLHLEAVVAEILDGLAHAGDAAGAADVAVRAGHVGQHADADGVVRGLGAGPGGQRRGAGGGDEMATVQVHGRFPGLYRWMLR